jgi:prefoldin alpha subunit
MSAVPFTISNEREINPVQLSLEQLSFIKTQHEDEIIELNKQLEALIGAKNRYLLAKNTVSDISSTALGTSLLVPLNSSLYVQGTISSQDKVIVELGTGYFCEKSIPDAKDLIDRKVGKLIIFHILFSYFICLFFNCCI